MARKILIIDDIHPSAFALLKNAGYEFGKNIADPDGILVRSSEIDVSTFGQNLMVIGRAGVGVDTIKNALLCGVCVFNAAGANAEAVADLVSHFLIGAARHVFPSRTFVDGLDPNLDQAAFTALIESGKKMFTGRSLKGRTLGIIGFGNVGGLVATDAVQKWKMHVIAFDIAWTDANRKLAEKLGVKIVETRDEVVREAGYLTFHIPGDDPNRNIINAELLAKMQQGATLLNLSRAEIVDPKAVRAALESGHLRYYLTDLPQVELRSNEAAVTTPHIGGNTDEAVERCSTMATEQMIDFLEHGIVNKNGTNFPLLENRPSANIRMRLCIPHRNKPGVLANVDDIMRDSGVNIAAQYSVSTNGIAYCVMDFGSSVPDELLQRVGQVTNVLRVNVCRF